MTKRTGRSRSARAPIYLHTLTVMSPSGLGMVLTIAAPLSALPLILMSLTLSSRFHMIPDQMLVSLKLAGILLHFRGLSQRSLDLCEAAIPTIVADGDLRSRGEAWVTQTRCLISCAGDLNDAYQPESKRELLESALKALDRAKEGGSIEAARLIPGLS